MVKMWKWFHFAFKRKKRGNERWINLNSQFLIHLLVDLAHTPLSCSWRCGGASGCADPGGPEGVVSSKYPVLEHIVVQEDSFWGCICLAHHSPWHIGCSGACLHGVDQEFNKVIINAPHPEVMTCQLQLTDIERVAIPTFMESMLIWDVIWLSMASFRSCFPTFLDSMVSFSSCLARIGDSSFWWGMALAVMRQKKKKKKRREKRKMMTKEKKMRMKGRRERTCEVWERGELRRGWSRGSLGEEGLLGEGVGAKEGGRRWWEKRRKVQRVDRRGFCKIMVWIRFIK